MTDDQARNVQQYEYDSFGNQHDMKNRIKQPYGYTGREHDRETGLRYYRARYYDGEVGRFISEDTIAIAGGDVNFYNYVGGNPINYVDPSGLKEWWEYSDLTHFEQAFLGQSGEVIAEASIKAAMEIPKIAAIVAVTTAAPEALPFLLNTGSRVCTAGAPYYTSAMVAAGTPAGKTLLNEGTNLVSVLVPETPANSSKVSSAIGGVILLGKKAIDSDVFGRANYTDMTLVL